MDGADLSLPSTAAENRARAFARDFVPGALFVRVWWMGIVWSATWACFSLIGAVVERSTVVNWFATVNYWLDLTSATCAAALAILLVVTRAHGITSRPVQFA